MKTASWGLMFLLVSPVGIAAAQPRQNQAPQQDPVAAAARRTRDQKKDQAKAAKVYDNDSLPTTPGGINVVGQAAPGGGTAANAPATDQSAAAGAGQPNAAGAAAKPADSAAASAELSSAKEKLQSLQKDLDILQRTFTLDQQMYLSKPDHDGDKIGAAKLKDEQSKMADKQQEIADAQKKVDDLQAKLTTSGPK